MFFFCFFHLIFYLKHINHIISDRFLSDLQCQYRNKNNFRIRNLQFSDHVKYIQQKIEKEDLLPQQTNKNWFYYSYLATVNNHHFKNGNNLALKSTNSAKLTPSRSHYELWTAIYGTIEGSRTLQSKVHCKSVLQPSTDYQEPIYKTRVK